MSGPERHDLRTADRQFTGETIARGEPVPAGRFRVIVHIALFNARGDMLIQRRCQSREAWPGYWDLSAGGSAVAGETSARAARRELMEELGLKGVEEEAVPDLSLHFSGGFDDIYIARSEADPAALRLQPTEVAEARWADRDEVRSMLREGAFIPYRPELIDLLFALARSPGNGGRS